MNYVATLTNILLLSLNRLCLVKVEARSY